jgi:hypothetical protein
VALAIACLLDGYLYDGRHTEAALAMIREVQRAFGL